MLKTTIEIEAANGVELDKKKTILQAAAKIPMDDLGRIGQLIQNPKALAGLKQHWLKLKLMF